MKDLNFFLSYNHKKNKSINKHIVFYGFMAVFIFGIIAYGVINLIRINKLAKEVEDLKHTHEVLSKDQRVEEIIKIEKNIKFISENIDKLKKLDNYAKSRDFINESLLEDIKLCIPESIFLDSILINAVNIRIEGKSKDKDSISQFQYELSQIEYFNKVYIPEIKIQDEFYIFYLDIELKEGETVGTEVNDEQDIQN